MIFAMTIKNKQSPFHHNEANNQKVNYQKNFWEKGNFGVFEGKNKIKLHYAHFNKPTNQPNTSTILISQGRCESYLKYKETLYELHERGYQIFILDHRGQGLSDRLLKDTYKGYVDEFDDYAEDLYQFTSTIIKPLLEDKKLYLLAHSMGCAIALRMFQLYPNIINKAALLSPMIAINTGFIPDFLANILVRSGKKVNQLFSKVPWYFLGQKLYKAKPFDHNLLTQCTIRYKEIYDLYNKENKIQLGGVTFHWLFEALKAERNIFTDLAKIKTHLCVLQASSDKIVSNKKQTLFCQKLHQISPELIAKNPIIIKNAHHELLFEKDNIRTETIDKIIQFFESSTTDLGS